MLKKVSDFDTFGLDVSSQNYIDNQILGEIYVDTNNNIIILASTNNKSTHRNFLVPNYFFNTDIFDKRINTVPYINEILNYIYKHNLLNYIIEFCIFDIPVGINNENIVMYEIRTNY